MISADIQSLEPGAIVELFELDPTVLGGQIVWFHAGTNALKQPVVWQGNNYQPYPVQITGMEFTGSGKAPRPSIRIANVTGIVSAMILQMNDLLGAKVTRRRTLAKYLDAVNFTGGVNTSADPTAAFPDDVYFINRKSNENKQFVEFELSTSFDVANVTLPKRKIVQNICPWQYRSAECGYAGGPVADINDIPTTDAALDACAKHLVSCKFRFGQYGSLLYGGFPGASLT